MFTEEAREAALLYHRVWQQLIYIEDGDGVLHLWHSDGRESTFFFSADCFDEVSSHRWHIARTDAMCNIDGKKISLARLVYGDEKAGSLAVYQLDHDVTNCRRENLATGTRRQIDWHKIAPRSEFGVGICLVRGPRIVTPTYQVSIAYRSTCPFSPRFKTLEQAEACRDMYRKIALEVDAGKREVPEKAELMSIADQIRGEKS